jgi:hypothetical protein
MSKNIVIVLSWIPGLSDITGNGTAALTLKYILITQTTGKEISQHPFKTVIRRIFQDDGTSGNKNVAKNLERFNCKHT